MPRLIFVLALFISNFISAQIFNIQIDDDFSDWEDIPVLVDDVRGDAGPGSFDFEILKVAHDESWVYFYLEFDKEFNLQSDFETTMAIDTDGDFNTGNNIRNMGVDLIYDLASKNGSIYRNNGIPIGHSDIFLVSGPTYTSNKFEIAISRKTEINGTPLFNGSSINLAFMDGWSTGPGDFIPDALGGVSYAYENQSNPILPAYSISKMDPEHIRVMSYNVERDQLFDPARSAAFERIFQATQPDVIAFQEIYNNTSLATLQLIQNWLPGTWYHAKVVPDIIVVSRYPIKQSTAVLTNGAFLIEINNDKDLLIINAHTPCCDNNSGRQEEMDAMMAFLRTVKAGELSSFYLRENTPFIICGDMNMVGYRQQLTTLLEGDIINANWGPDFDPDWDGSHLEDPIPPTTGMPMRFTWYDEGSSFAPGRLDYMIYSGSEMQMMNTYTLFTRGLSSDTLQHYGLEKDDAVITADHLPLISDFVLDVTTDVTQVQTNQLEFYISPNPFDDRLQINFTEDMGNLKSISIYDQLGRMQFSKEMRIEEKSFRLNTSLWPNGIYSVILRSDQGISVQSAIKM